ncbi:Gfo/Idh/MocA family protein [Planomicrobium sp. CPCC 101110]|uniref:Gfo/Idh/MocA family protein n=1 Tax=Planomicrobium sp. CPCC 101110 TaxID=2599619 RepID=UPI0011B5FC82|nr:Gfo/Idh/MocA family oxidoreductase [Planomicrobium sp. CPCC 101110]TWT27273.1 Gfo/Idh/MocA family oxidoreductase [Planomicrobium sp. CPCC 101110]
MEKKKAVIIGGGNIAEAVHVPHYREQKAIEVVAVLGRNAERVQAFAERNAIPRFYTDADEMYAVENPDIASVCTPNSFHYAAVMKALENGCHVLCEKPPAISADEAWKMHQAAKARSLVLAYNFHNRFAEDVKIIREKAAAGLLGDIYVTKVQALRRSGIPGWGYFTNKELQGGGPLIDIGVHMLDAAMYVLGFPAVKRVTAKQFQKIGTQKSSGSFGEWDPQKYEVEDSLFGFIELEGGGLLQIETSFALHIKEDSIMNAAFMGDQAGATLFPAHIHTDRDGKLVTLYQKNQADPECQRKSMAAFIDNCLGKEAMIADGEQGFLIQQIVEALYRSAEKGESVSL